MRSILLQIQEKISSSGTGEIKCISIKLDFVIEKTQKVGGVIVGIKGLTNNMLLSHKRF